jgi:hypothetical protein
VPASVAAAVLFLSAASSAHTAMGAVSSKQTEQHAALGAVASNQEEQHAAMGPVSSTVSSKQEEQHAAAPSPGLPEPVLIKIMQLLPQQDRLVRAALVCKSWAAAANAVPLTDLVLPSSMTAAAAAGLCSWVQQHGRRAVVESIQVLKQAPVVRADPDAVSGSHVVHRQLRFFVSLCSLGAVASTTPVTCAGVHKWNLCKEPACHLLF